MTLRGGPRRDVVELIEWAQAKGWKYEGLNSGGHHTIRWPATDKQVTIAATPSDPRTLKNTRAEIRRVGGHPSESGPAAKYKKGRTGGTGFSMEHAAREARARREQDREDERTAAQLHDKHAALIETLHGISKLRRSDSHMKMARDLVERALRIEKHAADLGHPIPDPLNEERNR